MGRLRKFGPGSYKDENGKWHKPTLFEHPDLRPLLRPVYLGGNSKRQKLQRRDFRDHSEEGF